MGGVNFTRNRAWWHTAIWDEYGQRHQYLCFIPSLIVMMPMYWYGAFINRALEQNWAAKMYQLEYEAKRNRLTHNLIMEHFETHVEKVQSLLDEVKDKGFEKAFEHEIKNPFTEYIQDPVPMPTDEYLAELAEHIGLTPKIDGIIEHSDLPYWKRLELEKYLVRRKTPDGPYKSGLSEVRDLQLQPIHHTYLDPFNAPFISKDGYAKAPEEKL
jgi:hypothetical protein